MKQYVKRWNVLDAWEYWVLDVLGRSWCNCTSSKGGALFQITQRLDHSHIPVPWHHIFKRTHYVRIWLCSMYFTFRLTQTGAHLFCRKQFVALACAHWGYVLINGWSTSAYDQSFLACIVLEKKTCKKKTNFETKYIC